MAESVQRIIKGRALSGQDYASVQALKQALTDAVEGWNRHPTPFTWVASAMLVATAPMLGGTAWEGLEPRRPMPFLDVFVLFATIAESRNATGLGN